LKIHRAILCGNLQRVLNADRTHAQRFNAQAKILRRTGRRSEIEDVIDAPWIEGRADVSLLETEAGIMGELGKIRGVACGQVIDAEDRITLAEQAICEMRTKEPGGAGYKCGLWQSSRLQN
jgi:hypothetical protein